MSSDDTTGIDFLSFSPSLINILSHLKYKDIENIRLVNRRLNEIIETNRSQLDRPTISLQFSIHPKEESHMSCVSMSYYQRTAERRTRWSVRMEPIRMCDFCITKERIRLVDYPPAMEKYLLENGTLLTDSSTCSDILTLKNIKEREPFKSSTKYLDFAIGSIEEGLRLVLRLLFRRFYFKELRILRSDLEEVSIDWEYLEILMDEFKSSFSKCEWLPTGTEYKGLTKLYTTLGCGVHIIILKTNIEVFLPQQNFRSRITMGTERHRVENSLPCFVQLIKQWHAGDISMRGLSVSCNPSFPFSARQLLRSLRSLPLHSVKNTENETGLHPMEILLKRSSDDKFLLISYLRSQHEGDFGLAEHNLPYSQFPEDPFDDIIQTLSNQNDL